jgi:hypothetical protein
VDTIFLDRHRKKIAYLLKTVPIDASGSLEVQSHWARYACVVISGYVESSVQEILRVYTEERCPRQVLNYTSSQLKFFQSASSENLIRLIGAFDRQWETDLTTFLTEERRAAINSVIGNRHRIAHGLDVGVTVHQLAEWYPKVNEVVDFIFGLCLR